MAEVEVPSIGVVELLVKRHTAKKGSRIQKAKEALSGFGRVPGLKLKSEGFVERLVEGAQPRKDPGSRKQK